MNSRQRFLNAKRRQVNNRGDPVLKQWIIFPRHQLQSLQNRARILLSYRLKHPSTPSVWVTGPQDSYASHGQANKVLSSRVVDRRDLLLWHSSAVREHTIQTFTRLICNSISAPGRWLHECDLEHPNSQMMAKRSQKTPDHQALKSVIPVGDHRIYTVRFQQSSQQEGSPSTAKKPCFLEKWYWKKGSKRIRVQSMFMGQESESIWAP